MKKLVFQSSYDGIYRNCDVVLDEEHSVIVVGGIRDYSPLLTPLQGFIESLKNDGDWQQFKADVEPVIEPIKNGPLKIGRNATCHCGSGQKFKKCCMR